MLCQPVFSVHLSIKLIIVHDVLSHFCSYYKSPHAIFAAIA